MRIERLDLMAFGPFHNARLDFGQNPDALQVVYGRNEAGKSTTLRAIVQLLYGMPHQSADAYRHESKDLRIGATLVEEGGGRVRVVRRKGRVNTLLDPEGEPLDEALLVKLLGGTPRGTFEHMFGLNHESLRKGAEALLAGGGDLGEGLFDAGVGGAPVHRVLKQLREEAEALYKPRGKTPRLNVALDAARELGERRREAALPPEKWQEQKKALEKAEQRHRELSEQRAQRATEQARLARALKVLPKLRELDGCQAERDALGEVAALPDDAVARRVEAEAGLASSEAELARSRAEQAHVQAKLQALGEPPAQPLGEQVTQQLRERFGSYRKAAQDAPALEAQRREVASTVEGLRAALPTGVRARLGDDYRPPADLEARLRQLAAQEQKAADALAQREREVAEREDEVASLRGQLEALGPAPDILALQAALLDPRAQTDVAALRERRAQLETDRARIARGLRELQLPFEADTFWETALPPAQRLAELRDAEQQAQARKARLLERQAEVDAELTAVRGLRAALTARGEVPSESNLASARRARDEAFEPLCEALERGSRLDTPALEAFRERLEHADHLADRLWREADRVQNAAQLSARSEAAVEAGQALLRELEAWEKSRADDAETLRTLTAPLGLPDGLDAREATRRVEAAHQLRQESERMHALATALQQREAAAAAYLRELRTALAAVDGDPAPDEADDAPSLGRSLASAQDRVQQAREREALAQAKADALQTATRAHARAVERREQAERTLGAQRALWQDEAEGLGLARDAGAEEVLSCVRVLGELAVRRDLRRDLEARLADVQQELRDHEREVFGLCSQHLADPQPESVAEGVDRLDRHCQQLRDEARERARHREDLDKHAETARGAEARHAECTRVLRGLCERAGVPQASELPEAERRAQRARELDQRLDTLARELRELGDGEPLEKLRSLVEGVVPEQARARLADLEDELEELREAAVEAHDSANRLRWGLERYEGEGDAAELAERQEGHLADVLELSHQYLVRRVAERMLRAEVERYREANQGPLLKRASELVGPLTLGRYVRLKQDFEDEDRPRLYMVRADGQAVDVAAMSDGTRDALYLALRLSSLERFVTHNTPVPLVLDDCFIHFDDQRAEAALGVLGEYTRTTQVLLFTHHERLVELARRALGKAGTSIHDLDEARRLGEGRNDGPLFAAR